jgi:hypothetical protein
VEGGHMAQAAASWNSGENGGAISNRPGRQQVEPLLGRATVYS